MSLQDLVSRFQNGDGEGSLKKFDSGGPEAVLIFNPSLKDILESLGEQQTASMERYEEITNKMDLLESKVSDLLSLISSLGNRIESIQDKMGWIEDQLDEIKSDSVNKEVFNELQNEAKRYRNDWFRKRLSKTISKLIRFYDDLDYLPSDVDIQNLRKEVLNILKTQGVEKVSNDSNEFDPNYMKAVDVVETDQKDEDKSVDAILKEGFEYSDGKSIRPVEVKIAKYAKEENNE